MAKLTVGSFDRPVHLFKSNFACCTVSLLPFLQTGATDEWKTRERGVVIVGGGFGGLFTALDLGNARDVTLISDADHFLFTPMLYEYLSGEVEEWHIAPNYRELLDEDVNLIRDEVTDAVDPEAQTVTLKTRSEPLEYDVLVLAVGGVSNFAGVAGAAEHAIPFRKIAHADQLRQRMVDALDHVAPDLPPQDTQRALTFAVVGAGASGVELSTKMADLLRDAFKRRALRGEPRVLVIEMGDRVVPGMGDDIREFVEDALRESHVEVHTLTRVVRVTEKTLVFEHNGEQTEIETAAVVWAGGVRMNPLIENLSLEKTNRGLIVVKPTLQTPSHANVFALGDIAFSKTLPHPRRHGATRAATSRAGGAQHQGASDGRRAADKTL